ncbi:MAG: putative preprotein translocase YajC subunit [Chlamydiia bacterium]|nr:putative preprotein translocase YajC subunit [Chlamydiia bacterium]
MQITHFFLAADVAPQMIPPSDNGLMQTFSMIAVALVLFYFLLWRPEQKRRKTEEVKRATMKKGDRVSTISGILGVISKVNQDTVVLRMIDGAKIEFMKAAISDVQPLSEEESKKLSQDD